MALKDQWCHIHSDCLTICFEVNAMDALIELYLYAFWIMKSSIVKYVCEVAET